ncbi:hypothetical protein B0H16DRAFT_1460242 [Mycena metata]|uniref:Uncharacterized protein n=1 Tax=Mycena metata TaxID=1033252 RepID=A0AAD7IW53_9AGAR|nr:hypothetical protein B0H16DRAFT_1460242 [Mycena metata]
MVTSLTRLHLWLPEVLQVCIEGPVHGIRRDTTVITLQPGAVISTQVLKRTTTQWLCVPTGRLDGLDQWDTLRALQLSWLGSNDLQRTSSSAAAGIKTSSIAHKVVNLVPGKEGHIIFMGQTEDPDDGVEFCFCEWKHKITAALSPPGARNPRE